MEKSRALLIIILVICFVGVVYSFCNSCGLIDKINKNHTNNGSMKVEATPINVSNLDIASNDKSIDKKDSSNDNKKELKSKSNNMVVDGVEHPISDEDYHKYYDFATDYVNYVASRCGWYNVSKLTYIPGKSNIYITDRKIQTFSFSYNVVPNYVNRKVWKEIYIDEDLNCHLS